jgi:hypothetical protein
VFNTNLQQVLFRAIDYAVVAAIATAIALLLLRLLSTDRWQVQGEEVEGFVGHFDPIGFIATVGFLQGWLRPVLPQHQHMRQGRWGIALWVVATLALLLVVMWLLKYLRLPIATYSADTLAAGALVLINSIVEAGVWFAVLNILPIPPLFGASFIVAIAPSQRERVRSLYWPGVVVLLLLMYFNVTNAVLGPIVNTILRLIG